MPFLGPLRASSKFFISVKSSVTAVHATMAVLQKLLVAFKYVQAFAMNCRGHFARRKNLVVLVGQKKALAIAVRNASGRRRWSNLSEWLSQRID